MHGLSTVLFDVTLHVLVITCLIGLNFLIVAWIGTERWGTSRRMALRHVVLSHGNHDRESEPKSSEAL